MTAENRVLALQLAIQVVVPDGTPLPADKGGDVTTVATIFYRWLEGPAVLFMTVDPTTFDQAAPEGPGTPTVRKGTAVQLTDLQQVTLSIAEVDSKGQPDISVDYGDNATTIKAAKELTATMTYPIDDFELNA